MIKAKHILTCALFALPVVTTGLITGCAATAHQESTGQYLDSSALTAKVKAKFLADKSVKSLPITVNTYKNVVQLSGFVDNTFQKQRAVAIARSVPGVKQVNDAIVVKKY